jgi:hypothetical protein
MQPEDITSVSGYTVIGKFRGWFQKKNAFLQQEN